MNREFSYYYADGVSTKDEQLSLRLISEIEEKCRQQRSEAIYQAFASILVTFRIIIKKLDGFSNTQNGYTENKNLSAPVSYGRLNLHTE